MANKALFIAPNPTQLNATTMWLISTVLNSTGQHLWSYGFMALYKSVYYYYYYY